MITLPEHEKAENAEAYVGIDFDEILKKLPDIIEKGSEAYRRLRPPTTRPPRTAILPPYAPPMPVAIAPTQTDNTLTYVLIGGGVLVAGIVVVLLLSK